jgi:hypothetical protein
VASSPASPEELWEHARADAGAEAGDVALIEASSFSNPNSQGRFMPPGERTAGLSPDDLARVNANASRPRIVLPVSDLRSDPRALLALMRHHLEYARVLHSERGSYALSLAVAACLYPVYEHAGPGSAVLYNAIPMMRSANAAAGRLVARTFGPPFDRLNDARFSSLFRLDDDPLPLTEYARHTTVFAAIWPDALEAELLRHGGSVAKALTEASADATRWWDMLRMDDTFGALALGASSFRPTPDEVVAFGSEPSRAWRLAYALIDRASWFGLSLTTARPRVPS